MSRIKELIKKIKYSDSLFAEQELVLACGRVTKVDKETRLVTVETFEGVEIEKVMLSSLLNKNSGVVIYPREGSECIVIFETQSNQSIVLLTDDIESIEVVVSDKTSRVLIDEERVRIDFGEGTSAELTKGGVVLNGGSLRGMVKIAELEENLNQLKTYVETLKRATSSGINAVGVSTAANGPAGATAFDGAMASANINFKNMENERVKQ